MALKFRLSAFALMVLMVFSGVVCGENLLIGGIMQNGPNQEDNPRYQEMATQLKATYIPTYYGEQEDGMDDIEEVRKAAMGEASIQNGLENDALSNHYYDTIVAYSGGTSTVVTALADADRKLTCGTLVLISPMAAGVSESTKAGAVAATGVVGGIGVTAGSALGALGGPFSPVTVPAGAAVVGGTATAAAIKVSSMVADSEANRRFEKQIDEILTLNPELKIIVIQSPEDKPTILSETYQYTFPKDKNTRITVDNVPLDSKGEDAHKDLFFAYAKENLEADNNGDVIYLPSQPTLNQECSAYKKPEKPNLATLLGMSPPLLSPSTSGASWSSDQNIEKTDVLETTGDSDTYSTLTTDKSNDVYYVDALSWSGDRSKLSKPAAPLRFVSGELNTYGYNWIYLPFEQTGLTYDQGYYDWAQDTLAAMGSSLGAGVGVLSNEGGGGGW